LSEPPLGVKILAAYSTLVAVILLLGGLVGALTFFGIGGSLAAGYGAVFAVLYLIYAFGMWRMERWAWYLGMILWGFSLVSSLLSLSLLKCIIPAIILYYLWVNQKLFDVSVKL
jgi:uncharacterized membrane protein (DUF2068 family)